MIGKGLLERTAPSGDSSPRKKTSRRVGVYGDSGLGRPRHAYHLTRKGLVEAAALMEMHPRDALAYYNLSVRRHEAAHAILRTDILTNLARNVRESSGESPGESPGEPLALEHGGEPYIGELRVHHDADLRRMAGTLEKTPPPGSTQRAKNIFTSSHLVPDGVARVYDPNDPHEDFAAPLALAYLEADTGSQRNTSTLPGKLMNYVSHLLYLTEYGTIPGDPEDGGVPYVLIVSATIRRARGVFEQLRRKLDDPEYSALHSLRANLLLQQGIRLEERFLISSLEEAARTPEGFAGECFHPLQYTPPTATRRPDTRVPLPFAPNSMPNEAPAVKLPFL